ncbi:MAG: hypothetical protein E6Y75_09110, partial [Anaerococcus sp.]|nr:hypothetical protein [Anaerococcus sp.]
MKMEKGELIGFQGCLSYDYDPTTKSIYIKEEEINDNTLVKDLKKLENQLNRIISQERKLVDLHLEDNIDEEVYTKKYKKLTKQKEELLDEKKTLELTIKDESFIKE